MLIAILLVPLIGALLLASMPSLGERLTRLVATLFAVVPLCLLVAVWIGFDPAGPRFQHVVDLPWIPAVGAGLRLGVDGIALVIATTSALLFTIAAAWPFDRRGKARQYSAAILALEAVCLGLFLALDLLLFYVCFDLSLVAMYFCIATWGHEGRRRAAIQLLLFTLGGSLVMLLGILGLVLAADPVTFDMRVLMATHPLAGTGLRESLVLGAILLGLAVKTPLLPVHTWLPDAHVEAPAPVSAVLAGVLLKMGTFGMIRIGYELLPGAFGDAAGWLGTLAVVSLVYGAFAALGQQHVKRRIAYTSITHMGYTVLGIALAGSMATGSEVARRLALTGATLEMVAHGLITGALFLVAGSLWQRTDTYDMDELSGVAARAPRLTALAVVAAFASLGLPALAGFVAEFQIFAGALALRPWLAGLALVGVLVTAALFVELLQRVFMGRTTAATATIRDLGAVELVSLAVLMLATVAIGVAPAFILAPIDAASRAVLGVP